MKRPIAILISIIMMLNFVSFQALANPKETTEISVISAVATAGSNVDVEVKIQNNPGVLGAIVRITYDEELTLLNAVNGSAFSALDMTKPGMFQSPCQFTWDSVDIDTLGIKDGTILQLTFKVPENAVSGKKYSVAVSGEN